MLVDIGENLKYLYGMIWFGDGGVCCLLDGYNEVDYIGVYLLINVLF